MPTVERHGVKLHYEVRGGGDGLPLLLSHGFGATSGMWAKNVDALGAERTVVTWDLRGHGASDAPTDAVAYTPDACVADMLSILDEVGIERAGLGGHSLGGFLSLAFRVVHPERVGALLLFDTGPGYRNEVARAEWNQAAETMATGLENEGLESLRGSPEMTGAAQDPVGLAYAARGVLMQHDSTVIDSLPSIDVPTLVLVGEYDRRFRAGAAHLAAKVPGARLVTVPSAGHAPNLEHPQAFNRAVVDFLDRYDERSDDVRPADHPFRTAADAKSADRLDHSVGEL